MPSYIYITNPARIKKFLEKIQSLGVPLKISQSYLETIGFKSKNDRPIITIMKALNFAQANGNPTERWKEYRDTKKARKVLGQGIKEHYAELFSIYENAHLRSNEDIHNFFKSQTTVGEITIDFMVRTFKQLVELADFEAVQTIPPEGEKPEDKELPADLLSKQIVKRGFVININIQLTLPETADAATYEAFFSALKKHLLNQK